MVVITFPDEVTQNRGLGFLMTHFSGRARRGGIHIVPVEAVAALAAQGIPFTMKGRATYEQQVAPQGKFPSRTKRKNTTGK